MESNSLVIGKRITVGGAINGTATAIAAFFPDKAVAIMGLAIPITAAAQVYVVNKYGVTQPDKK